MDDDRFDSLARSLAAGRSRRAMLKGMLGLGGAVVVTAAALPDHADAARRGFSGPVLPTPCVPSCSGTTCGPDGCGGSCRCGLGLICIIETVLCGTPCAESGGCESGCICEPVDNVC